MAGLVGAVATFLVLPLAPVVPGDEFRVNTYTTGDQIEAAVAMDADGDFVVVWTSWGQDGGGYGVFAQRYGASGTRRGSEFRVNTHTANYQEVPAVAMDAAGNFVVAWTSSGGQDGSLSGIFAQRYDAAGTRQGGEFQVNTYTTGYQSLPAVAMDATGNFVVAWNSDGQDGDSWGVFAQRYDVSGTPQGGEFRVNTYTTDGQFDPTIAMDAAGNFVVAWTSEFQDGSDVGIFAQRYAADGTPQGSEFQVNTYTASLQWYPVVGMDIDGDFVVIWESLGQDGSGWGVFAQRYDANGTPQGSEFLVNTRTTENQSNPAIAMDADGDFAVFWDADGQDGSGWGIFAQRHDAAGTPQGSEFQVNTFTTGDQNWPAVAMDAGGNFVAVWMSAGQDGSGWGVFGRGSGAGQEGACGDELAVNTFMTSLQDFPAVAMDADGDFVVAWISLDLAGDLNIFARRFDATCTPQGAEFQVNTNTTDFQSGPAVAMDTDGDLVVVWESLGQDGSGYGIFAQRYAANGTPQGSEFQVNTFTTGDQRDPAVAMDALGDFVVVWESSGQDGSDDGVFAQRYAADGTPQGSEFQVNTFATNSQSRPAVAMDTIGDFVVVWQSDGQDGSFFGVFAQRYAADGTPQGGEFQVNTFTTNSQGGPAVAMDADGDFVVVWHGDGQDGSFFGIFAQRYAAAGTPQGSEFQVNTYTANDQSWPAVAMDDGGDFVVVWNSNGQDGSFFGIFARRYAADGTPREGELPVNTFTTNDQSLPAVAMDDGGGAAEPVNAVSDTDNPTGYSWTPANLTVNVNTTVTFTNLTVAPHNVVWDSPNSPPDGPVLNLGESWSVVMTNAGTFDYHCGVHGLDMNGTIAVIPSFGDFVAVWRSFGQDGDSYGIFGRGFPGTPAPDATFTGKVKDANRNPLADATVEAKQGGVTLFSTMSAANGSYTLPVAAGTYDLVASLAGHLDATKTLTISAGQTLTRVKFKLFRPSFFQGMVTEKGTGMPLEGALVEASRNGATVASTTTAADGSYSLQVTKGTYRLRASQTGYKTKSKLDQSIGDGATKTGINFALAPLP